MFTLEALLAGAAGTLQMYSDEEKSNKGFWTGACWTFTASFAQNFPHVPRGKSISCASISRGNDPGIPHGGGEMQNALMNGERVDLFWPGNLTHIRILSVHFCVIILSQELDPSTRPSC